MKIIFKSLAVSAIASMLIVSCNPKMKKLNTPDPVVKNHSYGNSNDIKIKHIQLNLDVNFDQNQLQGNVVRDYENVGNAVSMVRDQRLLHMAKVTKPVKI